MIARGALHVHTDLSHDGLWTLAEMAEFFRKKRYQFVGVAEHSEDMDETKREYLRRRCAEVSTPDCCIIPGIEYSCSSLLHIAGIGCDLPLDTSDPVRVANAIRSANGFAILAHPRRIKWQCADALLTAISAIEVWNVRYDSKFVPIPASIEFLKHARTVNPDLRAAGGLDLHSERGFYPVATMLTVDRIDRDSILAALAAGDSAIASPLWKLHATESVSNKSLLRLRTSRTAFEFTRSLRNRLVVRGGSE